MKSKITIKEIAKETGFSIATVSNVINKTGKFYSSDTESIINKKIKELNYTPHAIARELKRQKSKTIGYIVPYTDSFYNEILEGIQDYAFANGYSVALYSTNYNEAQEDILIQNTLEQRYAGLILVQGLMEENKIREINEKIPMVVIGSLKKSEGVPLICINNYEISKETTKFLISLGHRQIGFICGPLSIAIEKDRFDGYIDALQEEGIKIDTSLIFEDKNVVMNNLEDGYEMVSRIIKENRSITALFITSDIISCVAMKAITDCGLKVPEDISVCGFDDLTISKYLNTPLTSIQQHASNLGSKSIELLVKRINGEKWENYISKGELIIRESTGRAKKLH